MARNGVRVRLRDMGERGFRPAVVKLVLDRLTRDALWAWPLALDYDVSDLGVLTVWWEHPEILDFGSSAVDEEVARTILRERQLFYPGLSDEIWANPGGDWQELHPDWAARCEQGKIETARHAEVVREAYAQHIEMVLDHACNLSAPTAVGSATSGPQQHPDWLR